MNWEGFPPAWVRSFSFSNCIFNEWKGFFFFFFFFLSLIEIFSCEFRLLRPALGPFCSGRRSNASFLALRRSGFQINFRLGCLFFFFFSDMGIQLFWQYLSKGLNFSRASQMPGLNVDWPGQSRLRTAVILLHAAHATRNRTAPVRGLPAGQALRRAKRAHDFLPRRHSLGLHINARIDLLWD